jgi:hypothetical protein
MEQICHHCKQITECTEIGKRFLCKEHKGLKQYQVKEKKTYTLKRTPLKPSKKPIKVNKAGPNKVSKREARNIKNKHKAYDLLAESVPHFCTGCGTGSNLTHSHLIPTGQNKKLEAVVSNITYHCIDCHTCWEHDVEGRKLMADYETNMHKISILDPEYYALIKGKE